MSKLCFGCMQPKENSPICEHCGFDERTENQSHQLPIGTSLQNQYLIGRVLGQGGFGITYLGWDQHLSLPVAIKEYYPAGVVHRHTQLGHYVMCDNGQSPEVFAKHRERFLKEARTLAQLSDIPEIVKVRNFFPENGTAYIVMEYVHGITLKQYLKSKGKPMTEQETLQIVEPVLNALGKVHAHQMIHRDISPDNIMLPITGGVKLIDFGTVRYVDGSGVSKSTETVLKAGFAPMEQYNAHGNLGTWTDVYALCASFHYLMTGRVPPDVHERMESGEALTLLRNTPGISSRTVQILEQGMKLRYSERIQTVEELQRLLYGNEKLKTAPVKKEEKKQTAEKKRKKALIPALGAVAAAVAVVGFLGINKPKPSAGSTPENTNPIQSILNPVSEEEIEYQNALSLMGYGRYENAVEIFDSLGDYKDSADNAAKCRNAISYAEAENYAAEKQYGKAAIAFAKLDGYEDARERSFAMWKKVKGRKMISMTGEGYKTTIHALREDGTIAVDRHESDSLTAEEVAAFPISSFRDIVSIQGYFGLRYDGTVAVPDTEKLESFVSANMAERIREHCNTVSAWNNIIALSVDTYRSSDHSVVVGLRSDGKVLVSGNEYFDQRAVADWTDIIAISQDGNHIVGLRSDGTVLAAGDTADGRCDVTGWTDIVDIATGSDATIGLTSKGRIVTAGSNMWGATSLAQSWNSAVELEDGPFAILGTGKASSGYYDGSYHSNDVGSWSNIVAVATNGCYTAGLQSDGTLVFTGSKSTDHYARASTWTDIQCP